MDTFKQAVSRVLLSHLTKKAFDLSPEATRALTGAALGGAAGAFIPSKSVGHRAVNALAGAGLGGAIGYHTAPQGDIRYNLLDGGPGLTAHQRELMSADPNFKAQVEASLKQQELANILRNNR